MVNNQFKTKKKLLATLISSFACANLALAADEVETEEEDVEEVLVQGIRDSLSTSNDLKRNSSQLIEVITAEDIGKMPDQNIAESLQRLTGIQIDRNDGEGTKVRIRGLDQNVTLFNGDTFLSGMEYFQLGEARVEFTDSLESIPAELLGGVEVFKSPKASLVEGGMGGAINLKTRNAFTLDGPLFAGSIKNDQGQDAEESKPSGTLVIGNNWGDELAAIFSLTGSQKTVHADQAQSFSRQAYQLAQLADGRQYIRPGMLYFTDGETDRNRLGASLAVQWRPTNNIEVGLDWFHSELDLDRRSYSVKHDMGVDGSSGLEAVYPFQASDKASGFFPESSFMSPELVGHNVNGQSISHIQSGTFIAGGAETNTSREMSDITSDNIRLKGSFDNQKDLKIKSELSVSTASYASEYAFSDSRFSPYGVTTYTGEGTTGWQVVPNNDPTPDGTADGYDDSDDLRVWTYDQRNGAPSVSYADASWLTDPRYLNFKSHWAFGDRVENDALALKVDGELDVDFGNLKVLSFGMRVASEEVDFVQGHYLANLALNGGQPTLDPTFNPSQSGEGGRPGTVATIGYGISDLDGDGISDAQLWGSEYRFLDAGIGDKCADATTSDGTALCEAIHGFGFDRFGDASPGIMPWETYLTQADRATFVGDFFPSGNYQGALFDDADRMSKPKNWFQQIAGNAPVNFREDPLESWNAKQQTSAVYFMADFVGDDLPYELNLGLRAIHTKTELTVAEANLAEHRLWSTDNWNGAFRDARIQTKSKDYIDLLPSMNLVWNLDDEQILRASASQVIARPNLQDLGKGFNQDLTRDDSCNCFRFNGGTAGNVDLDPFRASQLDLSYEYYFDDLGLASATAFFKEVDSFIASRSVQESHPDQTPEGASTAGVTRPFNGDGGKVNGLELAYQMGFENGLGFSSNFTYSDSTTNLDSLTQNNLPLPGVSETAYNIIGFFENQQFSARIAYSWRDKFLAPTSTTIGVNGLDKPLASWYDEYGQLDASLTWKAYENVSVSIEAINIEAQERTRYLEWEDNFFTYDSQEARYILGVTAKF